MQSEAQLFGRIRPLAFTFVLIASQPALAWQVNESFDVGSGGELQVRTDVGSIEVDTHTSDTIEVEVDVVGYDEDEFDVKFDQQGDDLVIEGDADRSVWGNKRVRFTIVVPEQYNVDLRTSGGSIVVENLHGQVDVHTSGGSLTFNNIVGDVDGDTSGGSVELESVDGDADIHTSGGSITAEEVSGDLKLDTSGGSITAEDVGGDLEAETSGGSIRINNVAGGTDASTSGGSVRASYDSQPSEEVYLHTSGGGITVELADDISMTLDAKANRIRSDFPVDGQTSAKHRLQGDINDGGPFLTVKSSSGNITILKD